MEFRDYFNKRWAQMTFREKACFRWVSFWGWIECYWQLFLHRVFKVDWHKGKDK